MKLGGTLTKVPWNEFKNQLLPSYSGNFLYHVNLSY